MNVPLVDCHDLAIFFDDVYNEVLHRLLVGHEEVDPVRETLVDDQIPHEFSIHDDTVHGEEHTDKLFDVLPHVDDVVWKCCESHVI